MASIHVSNNRSVAGRSIYFNKGTILKKLYLKWLFYFSEINWFGNMPLIYIYIYTRCGNKETGLLLLLISGHVDDEEEGIFDGRETRCCDNRYLLHEWSFCTTDSTIISKIYILIFNLYFNFNLNNISNALQKLLSSKSNLYLCNIYHNRIRSLCFVIL